jgi:drug efflux transport system ATP-binding protein
MNELYNIRADNLRKNFGDLTAVNDVSLHVKPGELYGLVGPDGAGKTTTIRLLVGALKLDGGSVSLCGFPLDGQLENARETVGYLSQRFSLYEDLTVLENIRFFAELRGLKANEWMPRCMEILEFVGLAAYKDRRAGQLSGGMKQKLGLASSLVTRPRILLLDEPTTGVDPVTRQDFWQLLIHLVMDPPGQTNHGPEEKVAVLISTPYMDEAARCNRIGFMRHGRIIAEGAPSEIRSMLDGRVVELLGSPLPQMRALASQDAEVEDVRAFGDRLHLRVKAGSADKVIARLRKSMPASGVAFADARVIPPVLEDVFIVLSESQNA